MKLDLDCIRDILLCVEESVGFMDLLEFQYEEGVLNDLPHLNGYDEETIMYHVKQCSESGLLSGVQFFLDGSAIVSDLSPRGHEFLSNVRSDTNWRKTKEVAQKVGSASLNAVEQIAAKILSELISGHF